jgi:hypothetical protein
LCLCHSLETKAAVWETMRNASEGSEWSIS